MPFTSKQISQHNFRAIHQQFLAASLCLLVILASPTLWAQDATDRILGTVYDQRGAVIPDVEISVINTATQLFASLSLTFSRVSDDEIAHIGRLPLC
jgi:hypothetical protein